MSSLSVLSISARKYAYASFAYSGRRCSGTPSQTSSAERASRKRSCVSGGSWPSSSSALLAAMYNGPWISTSVPSRSKKTALNSRAAKNSSGDSQPECVEMPGGLSSAAAGMSAARSVLVEQQVFAPPSDHLLHVVAGLFVRDILDPLVIGAGRLRDPLRDRILARIVCRDNVKRIAAEHPEQVLQIRGSKLDVHRRIVKPDCLGIDAILRRHLSRSRRNQLHKAARVRARRGIRIEQALLTGQREHQVGIERVARRRRLKQIPVRARIAHPLGDGMTELAVFFHVRRRDDRVVPRIGARESGQHETAHLDRTSLFLQRFQLAGLKLLESQRAQRLQSRHVILRNAVDRRGSAGLRLRRRCRWKIRVARRDASAGELGIVVAVGAVGELGENRASLTGVARGFQRACAPVLAHIAIGSVLRASTRALEAIGRRAVIAGEIQRPRDSKARILGGVAAWIARSQPPILRARRIELMQFFEYSADAEHRARRQLAAGKIRDHPIESRARLIVLIVMPVDQCQSLKRRGRIRSVRRDLQIFENRLFGVFGFRLELPRRNPDQLRANGGL